MGAFGQRGPIGVLVVLACLLGLAAAPAGAQLPSAPLPGSSFEGGDGDQADADAVDWETLQAQGGVQHSPDADTPDSIFASGSKELRPGEWGLGMGSAPDKSNIVDAWTAVDQPGADSFVYLAFARESANGDAFLTFELNHDGRLWNNGFADIPCRRTGDVLVSYEAGTKGVEVVLRRWTTTEADQSTGCAKVGGFDAFRRLTRDVNVQGAVNGAAIPSFLPGVYDTVPRLQFGEASLNLGALLERRSVTSAWRLTRCGCTRAPRTPCRRTWRTTSPRGDWRCGRARRRAQSSLTPTTTICARSARAACPGF